MCLGIPGRVVKITDIERQLALVDIGGVQREVSLECVTDPWHPLDSSVGDWVLVHVGFAMSRINEDEAAATLKILKELGELQAEHAAMQQSAMQQSATGPTADLSPLPRLCGGEG